MNKRNKAIIENDLILVYVEKKPAFFARVEKIYPDIKPGWWKIKILILQVPLKVTTWVLDNEQVRGAEFTMSGTPVRIEKIKVPEENYDINNENSSEPKSSKKSNKAASILSMNSGGKDK